MDAVPAAGACRSDVFQPIIEKKNLLSRHPSHLLDALIEFRVGLHRAVLVGKNIAFEVPEKGEVGADMLDGGVVGVGGDESRGVLSAKIGMKGDHRLEGRKNVGEEAPKFLKRAIEALFPADLGKKLAAIDL